MRESFAGLKLALLVVLGCWANMASVSVCAEESARSEYEVKAGIIYNVAKFVSWPQLTQPEAALHQEPQPSVNFCILGDDPFGSLMDALGERRLKGRNINIKRLPDLPEKIACDVLYISGSEESRLKFILQKLGNNPVLSISDIHGFAKKGGGIELMQSGKRVQFNINNSAVKSAGLRMSAKLLELAKIVY